MRDSGATYRADVGQRQGPANYKARAIGLADDLDFKENVEPGTVESACSMEQSKYESKNN